MSTASDAGATTIVVPCFNEEKRLDPEGLLQLLARPGVHLLLVDDGSSDGTWGTLEALQRRAPTRVHIVRLERNGGKAEAVRQGLLAALARGSRVLAYLDADLATPPPEMLRLLARMDEGGAEVVLGARVALLGHDIQRNPARHYLGRVFASVAAVSLGLRVYDTQCGAKVFKASPLLTRALDAPFGSRWIFDVELIGRLLDGGLTPEQFVEVPLGSWRDVRGSTLKVPAMVRALGEVTAVGLRRRLGYGTSGGRRK